MIPLWPSTIASLDDSLTRLSDSLEKLKAAKPVDITEVIEQLKTAAEAARNLRALVTAEMPEASWQDRRELDVLIAEIQKRIEARHIEGLRSRLIALAAELERGTITHRRAVRVTQLNQLRDAAAKELRGQAAAPGKPQELPGPEPDEWLEWACGLQEPDDTESLQTLRREFARLDDFVANLEPNMWVIKKEILV
ncbi:MAG: hypothetical protein WAL85_16080 [Candidatus Korobacteraceae bacterium]